MKNKKIAKTIPIQVTPEQKEIIQSLLWNIKNMTGKTYNKIFVDAVEKYSPSSPVENTGKAKLKETCLHICYPDEKERDDTRKKMKISILESELTPSDYAIYVLNKYIDELRKIEK